MQHAHARLMVAAAVEGSERMAATARAVVKANGLDVASGGPIEVVAGRLEDLELPVDTARHKKSSHALKALSLFTAPKQFQHNITVHFGRVHKGAGTDFLQSECFGAGQCLGASPVVRVAPAHKRIAVLLSLNSGARPAGRRHRQRVDGLCAVLRGHARHRAVRARTVRIPLCLHAVRPLWSVM